MAACTTCNLCESPGTLADAVEVGRVPCNVRQFKDDLFTMWRCNGCGSIHCAEDVELARYYSHYPLKIQKVGFHERIGYGNRLKLLKRQGLQKQHRILDYGCGAGLFVRFLQSKGYRNAFGYDPFVPEFCDPRRLEESFDAVVSYDVIEHDENPRVFMQALRQLVRPTGLLVIGTPNADHISIARTKSPSLHAPYHRHILSERMLVALAGGSLAPVHRYRRSFYDSLFPTVNSRFMWGYIQESGGLLDAAVEPPSTALVLRSPDLILAAFFGYLAPIGDNILVSFRKVHA